MQYKSPERLREGDTIAVLTPSWGGPQAFPNVYEHGIRNLKEIFHLEVKEYPSTRANRSFLQRHPDVKAQDLCDAFSDDSIKGIIASVGGSDSIRMIDFLDMDAIIDHPKVLMGYSDTTSILTYLNQKGLVTFYGPMIMSGFAQLRHLPEQAVENIRSILFEPQAEHVYRASGSWSNGYPDWGIEGNEDRTMPLQTNKSGWSWLQGEGIAKGRLYGGCLDVMVHLRNSPYWPKLDFWDDKILFLESTGEAPSPKKIRIELDYYGLQGILDRIKGLMYGRPRGPLENKKDIDATLVRSICKDFHRDDLVIVSNMDFGHTDPQFVLPLGIMAELDPAERSFRTVETATV